MLEVGGDDEAWDLCSPRTHTLSFPLVVISGQITLPGVQIDCQVFIDNILRNLACLVFA